MPISGISASRSTPPCAKRRPVPSGCAHNAGRGIKSDRLPGNRRFDDDDPDARIDRRGDRWRTDEGYGQHPVVEVTWLGARAYCASVGKLLPTDAEREKAARGTDARRYCWGNEPPDATRARLGAGWNATVPVGSYPRGAGHNRAPEQLTTTQPGRTLSRNPAVGHDNIGFRCAL